MKELATIVLDGAEMTSLPALHRYLAETLRFPDWYGANLDALADCLAGIGCHTCLELHHVSAMRRGLGEERAQAVLELFAEVAAEPCSFRWVICEDEP